MPRNLTSIPLLLLLLSAIAPQTPLAADLPAAVRQDVQLRAMIDELARSKTLSLNDLDKPYFISYSSNDAEMSDIRGSLGGLMASSRVHVRQPVVHVRVGNYSFDNTDSVFASPARLGPLPLDDNYGVLRTALWFTTDGLYKAATGEIAAKRNTLREIAGPDQTPDFAPAQPNVVIQPAARLQMDDKRWETIVRNLSARFVNHPGVVSSSVRMRGISSTLRFVNTEGTIVRVPQELTSLDITAAGIAADGARVWNHRLITVLHPSELPGENELRKNVDSVARETEALVNAPLADDYNGPVLFEGQAAAALMAEVLTDATRLRRTPVAPSDLRSRVEAIDGVWSSRMGSKVTPDWLTIVDDPSQKSFGGQVLAGQYDVDEEGVLAQRVTLVDKGTLKSFLLTRQPVRTFNASNGHARLPGAWGAEMPVFGNLFIQANQTVPDSQMKSKLIEKVKTAGLKYGILIRRLDFPSTANVEELQEMMTQLQKSGTSRSVSAPILAYRVYPDGREELVRGLRFREFSAKDLRDVEAASDRPYVLNYVNNGSPFNWIHASSDATTSAVICPSLLFPSVDLARVEGQGSKPPLVPAPALLARQH
ncbi:MAG TPA: metallopeptidase TldD-related protein [Bryobacteraceae bacterium]|nr:metallopeptidase TldD-related protein [Bryobacteraceae bacterium]